MRTKTGFIVLAAAVAVAISLALRQQTLIELRADNESLRQQLDTQPRRAGPASDIRPTNSTLPLSPDDRQELLRLRGQFLPLQRELQAISNRVAMLAQPTSQRAPVQAKQTPRELPAEVQAEVQAVNAFMQGAPSASAAGLARALRKYLDEHAGALPDDIHKAEALAASPLPEGISQQFELMRSGTVSEAEQSYTYIAREKEPRQLADGKWVRIYLLANGEAFLAGPVAEPDWPARERSAEAILKQRAR